jgi:hypothetical protein
MMMIGTAANLKIRSRIREEKIRIYRSEFSENFNDLNFREISGTSATSNSPINRLKAASI